MTDFTEEQQAALNTLTALYPGGLTLTDDRVHDIEGCDSLVPSGHAVRIDSDDFDGVGFQPVGRGRRGASDRGRTPRR
jgi:hypothetical protein